MVYVVLRTGKVIRYNDGEGIAVESGTITIRTSKTRGEYLIARIPIDIVERSEFHPPCEVKRIRLRNGKDY